MRSKSQASWETAARYATLAQQATDPPEREHYERLRDAWATLAKRCEPFIVPDVTVGEVDGRARRDSGHNRYGGLTLQHCRGLFHQHTLRL